MTAEGDVVGAEAVETVAVDAPSGEAALSGDLGAGDKAPLSTSLRKMASWDAKMKDISLVGADFSVKEARALQATKGAELRESLSLILQTSYGAGNAKDDILLDYFAFLVSFSRKHRLTDEKASALLSIAKRVHERSTEEVLTLEKSLATLKALLLKHSVHRPPYSVGVFTLQELELIVAYMLDTYYRHYHLYQHVYVPEFVMGATQTHPNDTVEVAPTPPPLSEAITEAQREAQLAEARKAEEAERQRLREERAERERQRRAALTGVEVSQEVSDTITAAVDKQMAALEAQLKAQFEAREEELLKRIAELEGK